MQTRTQPATYLFLIRAFNDLDHVTPLLDRIARSTHGQAEVLCIEPRFRFTIHPQTALLKKHGVPMHHLHQRASSWRKGACRLVQMVIDATQKRSSLRSSSTQFLVRLIDLILARDRTLPTRIIHQGINCLLIDWSKTIRFPVRELTLAARHQGIPTVALPHGIVMFSYAPTATKSKYKPGAYDVDALLTCGPNSTSYFVRRGVPRNKIHDLGNMRFSDTWLERWEETRTATSQNPSPALALPEASGKFRIAFFTRKRGSQDQHEMRRTIESLGQIPDSIVALKLHTRDSYLDPSSARALPSNFYLVPQSINSTQVISWAQACINYGSSVVYEIYRQGKPHIHLEFLVRVAYDFVAAGAALVVTDPRDLRGAVEKVRELRGKLPYPADAVERLLLTNVYAGQRGDIVERYYRFIEDLSKQSST